MSRIFDCFIYNGESEVANIRFNELYNVVDTFFIIESDTTFSGQKKQLTFLDQARLMKWPLEKIIYEVHINEIPDVDPWVNERQQRNALAKVFQIIDKNDLVVISDVDEIPTWQSLLLARDDFSNFFFGFELSLSYFKLNYVNVEGPSSKVVHTVATRLSSESQWTFDELRQGIRNGSIPARIFEKSGWHFSYLSGDEGIRKKIRSFSHQELNTPEIMERVNVEMLLQQREDLFLRPGFKWEILGTEFLPDFVQSNIESFRDWIVS